MEQYIVTGMSCAACQTRVEKAVAAVDGVESVSVSLLTNSMGVEGRASSSAIIKAVEDAGYGAGVKGAGRDTAPSLEAEEEALKDRETPVLIRRLVFSAIFLLALMYITMGHNMLNWPLPPYFEHNHLGLTLTQLLLSAAVMLINGRFFVNGFKALAHRAPNMDSLVALGSSVSFAWSVFVFYEMCGLITKGADSMSLMELYHDSLYFESAAMIPALITIGKLLEALSKGRTTDALKSLIRLAPRTARLIQNGEEVEVPAEHVAVGDIFAVRPGESIPIDGMVIEGSSAVNESALTGESIPVDKQEGDHVSAATINQSGFLKCRATRVGEDTTLSQIIRMVSDAAATKAPIARIADRVSGVFVPAVIALSVLVVICWLIAGEDIAFSLARAISVLVISCPCALGLATPVAIMVGNGMGAKNGILFETGEALERAGRTNIIALDKTGTITSGEPAVMDIIPAKGLSELDLLKKAYSLENKSEHPLAAAIVKEATRRGLEPLDTSDFHALPGNGLEATVDGKHIRGGSERFIGGSAAIPAEMLKKSAELSEGGKTPLFFESDGELLGMIAVADAIKPDSAEAIAQLKRLGARVVMLTGDNERTAAAIGAQAGVDEWIAGVLPDGKEAVIRSLQADGAVAMVGDGINDAPALTRADIGIAIGAGTDVAVDSADIVLMNSRLTDVAAAIRLSRQTLKNIHENLFWAFFYNLICIPLAAGISPWKMNPMVAAAAMSLSSFTVCMNALRLNLFNMRDTSRDRPQKNKTVKRKERRSTMEQTVKIEGMMCAHCEATVKKALEALPFITAADVSHESGTARLTLSGALDETAIKTAVEDKDYTYLGVA